LSTRARSTSGRFLQFCAAPLYQPRMVRQRYPLILQRRGYHEQQQPISLSYQTQRHSLVREIQAPLHQARFPT
jgi:hypothetical protein